jgi:hypothetical protein
MENMDGFADLKKPLITPHSALAIASFSIAVTISYKTAKTAKPIVP